MLTENIALGLDLEVTTWEEGQSVDLGVFLNNNEIYRNNKAAGIIEIRLDDVEVPEDSENTLKVTVNGMKSDYTKLDAEKNIVDDVLVKINNVYLDEIPLDYLVYDKCEYWPEYPPAAHGKPCLNNVHYLGWDGNWNIKFTTPVYLWLLENM